MLSKCFELKKGDILAWLRMSFYIIVPSILLFLSQLENNDFNIDIKVFYALLVSVVMDLIRRYIKDYKEELVKHVEAEDINALEEYTNKK